MSQKSRTKERRKGGVGGEVQRIYDFRIFVRVPGDYKQSNKQKAPPLRSNKQPSILVFATTAIDGVNAVRSGYVCMV